MATAKAGMLSADGKCHTFDASANGYARGEGCGAVVVKRLSDALDAGDSIYAVLKGSAVMQDGRSASLTAPNGRMQEELLRATLREAGIEPAAVQYLEAHGTGTPLGDPIETAAIASVYGAERAEDAPQVVELLAYHWRRGEREERHNTVGSIVTSNPPHERKVGRGRWG